MRAIIVFYDSLNKRYLPCYNPDSDVIAPNFTRLKEHSCIFDNSFVGSMPCIPARRELHTGRYNFLHREWGPLEPFDDSMINMLKESGVYTHLVSDHLHYWEDGGCNYHTQYNSWEIIRGQEGDKWKGLVNDPLIPNVVRIPCAHSGAKQTSNWKYDWINREYIKKLEDFPQNKVFKLGQEFIEKNHDADNWLLHIETFDPHEPFYASEEFRALYPENYDGLHYDWPRGEINETEEEIKHIQREYKALVSMCDYHLGKILDMMDQYDLWKDTMLIVGTDHGILLSEHNWWSKNLMPYYDEIANTPLFIWDPRDKVKNQKRESLVQLIDWAPTILNYFNLKPTKDMLGSDLQETIKKDQDIHQDGILYGAFSAHVNYTDGEYTLMQGAKQERKDEVYNYTLMPMHMTKRFTVEEMKKCEYVDGFSFTKGLKLLKIPSNDKYKVAGFGTLIFDRKHDPLQNNNLNSNDLKDTLTKKMVKLMKDNDAPDEQYYRLDLIEK